EQTVAIGGEQQNQQPDQSGSQQEAEPAERGGRGTDSSGSRPSLTGPHGSATGIDSRRGSGQGEQRGNKPRQKHKEQWDRRLLSYVRQKKDGGSETDGQDNL